MVGWMSDEPETSVAWARERLPGVVTAAGAVLAGAAALPGAPGGPSWLDVAVDLVRAYGLAAVPLLVITGAPFLFGAAVALAGGLPGAPTAGLVRGLVVLLQAEVVYAAVLVVTGGGWVAPWAFLGFAAVTGGAMVVHWASSRASGSGEPPTLRWATRWGALLVVGAALWLRAQALGGAAIGPAIDVALGASAVIVQRLVRIR